MFLLNNMADSILCYSALLFLTNVFIALSINNYLYAFLFGMLTITSILYHQMRSHPIMGYIDKGIIGAITLVGAYIIFVEKRVVSSLVIAVISGFLLVNFFYFYGYYTKQFAFDLDQNTSDFYHIILHILCSVSNNLIMFV